MGVPGVRGTAEPTNLPVLEVCPQPRLAPCCSFWMEGRQPSGE